MTVVGSVEYDVLGMVDEGRFMRSIEPALRRVAGAAGTLYGTLFSQTAARQFGTGGVDVGDQMGKGITSGARQHGLTFGKLVGAGVTAGLGVHTVEAGFSRIAQGLTGSLDAADDLAAAVARNRDEFGAHSAAVNAFAEDERRNLLLTRAAILENTAIFGDIFRGAGVGEANSARLSVSLVDVAQKLAAIKHVGVEKTLAALQGGIEGNIVPVRTLGVDLSTARVQAEAYALGLAKPVKDAGKIATAHLAKVQREHGTGTLAEAQAQDKLRRAQDALAKATAGANTPLSAAQLIQARTSLILKDTERSTAAAASSTGDYSVSAQHLHKQLGDLSTTIGTALLPRATALADEAAKFVDEFGRGVGTGGEFRETLEGIGDVAKGVGDALRVTVLPVIRFFVDHPSAFKAAAEGMAAYAIASKSASIWNARLAVSMPAVAAGTAATAAAAPAAATGIGAIGAAGALALPQIAALGATLLAAYETAKVLKGLLDDLKPEKPGDSVYGELAGPGRKLFLPDPNNPGKVQLFDPAAPGTATQHPNTDEHGAPSVARNIQASKDVAKAAADAAKAGQASGDASQYAADQLAEFQERQRAAVEAAEDAARARGEATTRQLQSQADAIRRQVDVLSAYGQKISDFRSGIFAGTRSFTGLTSLTSDPSLATAGALVGSLQARVAAEKLFTKNITLLGQRDLDKGVLAELAQAGPENRAFASALAAGTPDQIRALNAAEKASRAQAQALAARATEQQFGSGAVAKNQAALAEQNRRLAHIEQLLGQQPALIAKAVDAAGKGVKAQQRAASRTAVPK